MPECYSQSIDTARNYYNSCDADNFYFTIWGGEDIHIGVYRSAHDSIFDASRHTVQTMCGLLSSLGPQSKVLDMGSGYAGAARYLAGNSGCRVAALNLSEEQNERGRRCNCEQGLEHLVDVVDGSFESAPYPDASFDVIWSQDSFLHSGNRETVLQEAVRVLKPGGEMVFTDPMMADTCPDGVLDPILARIHLETLGSPEFYRKTLVRLGMEELDFTDLSSHLPVHYARVLQETEKREDELLHVVSHEYMERMKTGLRHWIEGGQKGHLCWGIFHCRKPA